MRAKQNECKCNQSHAAVSSYVSVDPPIVSVDPPIVAVSLRFDTVYIPPSGPDAMVAVLQFGCKRSWTDCVAVEEAFLKLLDNRVGDGVENLGRARLIELRIWLESMIAHPRFSK